jgi:Family of unknown function (DUF6171)
MSIKSAWQIWKDKNSAKPWDYFNPNTVLVNEKMKNDRMNICNSCDRFIKSTTQCKECGCIMKMKTSIPHASCPLGKWNSANGV